MASIKLLAKCHQSTQRVYSPVSWTNYFDEAHDVMLDTNHNGHDEDETNSDMLAPSSAASFRIYMRNFHPPYAPDRRGSKISESSETELRQYSQYPTLVALHGGGYSALTWAQFTHHIEQECNCRVMAIDLRSHGDTKTDNDDKMDMDTLVNDVNQVVHAAHRLAGFHETPKIILIGHSMGGAIAIKCSTNCIESMPSLVGMVIIDVVEGTAKDALPSMINVIKTRPTKFPSLKNAIEWSVRSGMTKNLDAARVSMPGNLLNIASGHLSIHDIDDHEEPTICNRKNAITKHKFHISIENLLTPKSHSMTAIPQGLPLCPRVAALKGIPGDTILGAKSPPVGVLPCVSDPLLEECSDEDSVSKDNCQQQVQIDSDGYKKPPGVDESGYCWRTDLAKTQPYWSGWFEGLSEQLLNAPVQGKFLLLAGIDRLDKTLTIGQMQGKFMMKVLPKCGHAVHEDLPERVASEIGQFLVRNKFTTTIENK